MGPTAEQRSQHVQPAHHARPSILLVDDEAPILELLRGVLTRFGYRVIPASSPEEALALSDEDDLDLLITDVAMPGMTGVELHRRLSDGRSALPVLYLSGYVSEAAREFGVSAQDLLEKPFSLRDLNERVHAILAKI